jgi:hypothetical protein
MFEDTIFNTTNTSPTDTGVAITPDNGKNLIFARANCSAGFEGGDAGTMQATYDGVEIGIAEGFHSEQGAPGQLYTSHWNANDFGMIKLVDTDGIAEIKARANANSGTRSINVGAQQLLSIPLESMGLVEGVDYWYQEEHEDTPVEWKKGTTDIEPYDPATIETRHREISRLEWTAPETEPYLTFFSFESDMSEFGGSQNYSIQLITGPPWKSISSITESGGTATVTTTAAHGFGDAPNYNSGNSYVTLDGADQLDYNGRYKYVTVTDTTHFTYQVSGSPATPATGTIAARKESISQDSQNNLANLEGRSTFNNYQYNGYCWFAVHGVTAGTTYTAITGAVWQGLGNVAVRRCRILSVKISSLTRGWGVGAQWKGTHSVTGEGHWGADLDGDNENFAEIVPRGVAPSAPLTQTYTPAAKEQTLVFGEFVTQSSTDITPPRSNMTYALRNDTAGINFAEDMGLPIAQTINTSWTFGMGVIDDNESPSTWQALCREPNATANEVQFRRGYLLIIGLMNND